MAQRHNPGRGYREEFRIIAGRWRRRKLHFPPLPGIRPSPDRVRETLFNWLRDRVEGASCIDLFAGSGALGLEALSRGAAGVTFVDKERQATDAIRGHLDLLKAEGGIVVQVDAFAWLSGPPKPVDLVFLDPPFDAGLLPEICAKLGQGWLKPGAWVYLEHAADALPELPPAWQLLKESRAGHVGFRLVTVG